MEIISITGTIGAGKGTIVNLLETERKFKHFSVRKFLEAELKGMKLPATRDNMRNLGNHLRKSFGADYLIKTLFVQAEKSEKNSVIESVRCLGEVKFLKAQNVPLWGVDALQSMRYRWAYKRASSTDKVSYQEFALQEKKESRGKDPWVQNLPACLKKAQIVFQNDGKVEDLESKIRFYLDN